MYQSICPTPAPAYVSIPILIDMPITNYILIVCASLHIGLLTGSSDLCCARKEGRTAFCNPAFSINQTFAIRFATYSFYPQTFITQTIPSRKSLFLTQIPLRKDVLRHRSGIIESLRVSASCLAQRSILFHCLHPFCNAAYLFLFANI